MLRVVLLFYIISFQFPATGGDIRIDSSGIYQDTSEVLKFELEHINLGKVIKGELREIAYNFRNVSNETVEIDLVSSCECTTLEWPSSPILPGKEEKIIAIFDSAQKEKSETVDVDIILKNLDPKTGNPIMIFLEYSYELIK